MDILNPATLDDFLAEKLQVIRYQNFKHSTQPKNPNKKEREINKQIHRANGPRACLILVAKNRSQIYRSFFWL